MKKHNLPFNKYNSSNAGSEYTFIINEIIIILQIIVIVFMNV